MMNKYKAYTPKWIYTLAADDSNVCVCGHPVKIVPIEAVPQPTSWGTLSWNISTLVVWWWWASLWEPPSSCRLCWVWNTDLFSGWITVALLLVALLYRFHWEQSIKCDVAAVKCFRCLDTFWVVKYQHLLWETQIWKPWMTKCPCNCFFLHFWNFFSTCTNIEMQ